jgi:methyl-accepting chemotaxis protein
MFSAVFDLAGHYAWPLAGVAVSVAIAGFAVWEVFRLRRGYARIKLALNNMSEGLCMFSAAGRLIVCNERYVQMYGLSPELARRGSTLRELLEQRRAAGNFDGNPEQYIADLITNITKGKVFTKVIEHRGRLISITNRPMADGGWVATHNDVTEQRHAELQRTTMAEHESRRAKVEAAIASFRERVESVLKAVGHDVGAMKGTASGLLASSDQTSQRAQGAVQASNKASLNVDTAAAAAAELSSSIGEISRQLTRTTEVVRTAVDEADATNEQIAGLAEAAQKIGDVVNLIGDIAGQTNLLALNATIEAARAGEAGRGFAVVASEVKSLAVQTAKATEEITGQIQAVQTSSTAAVEAIGSIGARMREISDYTSGVAASVEEQNAATSEISANVASAAKGSSVVVTVLGEVAGAATDTRSSAQTVLTAAQSVESAVGHLRDEVESFLGKVAV